MKNFKTVLILILITMHSALALSSSANLGAFEAFGKKEGLTKMVDDFMVGLLAEKRMYPFFKHVDQKRTKEKLVEQFCKELDGPCEYTGKSMYRSHKGHVIKEQHFYALVEVLQKAMSLHKVPSWAQNKLLAKLAPMHKDIINE
jgi:hemoglobin